MLIVANWKAYVEDAAKAKRLVAAAKNLVRDTDISIILAPPAPFVGLFAHANRSRIAFAMQDVSATLGGAATGEVTAAAALAAGAAYTIVGHSERRALGDTDAIVAEKLAHASAQGLVPILCIGEEERDDDGRYLSGIRDELTVALAPLSPKERAAVIVAYEPLWAIGKATDAAIMPHDLVEMALYIRKVLAELLPGKSAARSMILYGGSVESSNIRDLAAETRIDGFLIGRASTDPASFTALAKELS